jgi:hypothetical protein
MSKTYLKSDHFNGSDPMAGPRHWHEEARRQMTWEEKRALDEQCWVSLAIAREQINKILGTCSKFPLVVAKGTEMLTVLRKGEVVVKLTANKL